MKRERIAWMVSFVLLCILAFQLPGTLASRDDDYTFVQTLVNIHRQIDTNYVEPVDDAAIRAKAIERGLIAPGRAAQMSERELLQHDVAVAVRFALDGVVTTCEVRLEGADRTLVVDPEKLEPEHHQPARGAPGIGRRAPRAG